MFTQISHSEYKKRIKNLSNDSLRYIIKDAREAIEANPDSEKIGYYLDEISYCAGELKKRKEQPLTKLEGLLALDAALQVNQLPDELNKVLSVYINKEIGKQFEDGKNYEHAQFHQYLNAQRKALQKLYNSPEIFGI